jgi:hypothetical protein
MTLLAEIWNILTPWQRRGILAMQAVSLVMAVSTATGIAAIAPFFAVLGDPQLIEHNSLLHWLYVRLRQPTRLCGGSGYRFHYAGAQCKFDQRTWLLGHESPGVANRKRATDDSVHRLRRRRGCDRSSPAARAHGMSAVRACEVIFHLEQGKIVGSGTYEGLLKSSAVFRRMAGVG